MLNKVSLLILTAFIAWMSLYKLVDTDVWWHIAAGRYLLSEGWFSTDPFAYTRVGLPYLASHEWLTQILFALTYNLTGSTGMIVLRFLCALATCLLILQVDRKHIWPNAFLVIAAASFMRQGFAERPQMLSNVCFAGMLYLGLHALRNVECKMQNAKFVGILLCIQILWANLHGAAALLSVMLLGAVGLQSLYNQKSLSRYSDTPILRYSILLLVATLLTPNHIHNITYVLSLLTDNTKDLIAEWAPRPWPQYLIEIGPFIAIAIVSTVLAKRDVIASSLILATMIILSRTASRHEVLLLITCLMLTFHQHAMFAPWTELMQKMKRKHTALWGLTTLWTVLLIGLYLPFHQHLQQRNLLGFGEFSATAKAYDFVQAEGIEGNMFNTYSDGGYLLFRGEQVFIDGRNVDYGYDLMSEALDARYSPYVFERLDQRFDFGYAIIAPREEGEFAYFNALEGWEEVYWDGDAMVLQKE